MPTSVVFLFSCVRQDVEGIVVLSIRIASFTFLNLCVSIEFFFFFLCKQFPFFPPLEAVRKVAQVLWDTPPGCKPVRQQCI